MKLNADLQQPVVVFTEDLPWRDSPMAGVQRRMLERDGDEVARATSIVRFAPNSYFSAHAHGGGEEFLVLDGIFSDEHGDYEPGTYVRNPVGSNHTPHSKDGCTIFVKLWQMHPEDGQRLVIPTTQAEWLPGEVPGLQAIFLHSYETERVALMKLAAGIALPSDRQHGEEIFVLEGVLKDERGIYPKGSWLRYPPGNVHSLSSHEDCSMYRKIGHLDM